MKKKPSNLSPELQCRYKAFDLLSRREHSASELKQKLLQRGFEVEMVQLTLDWLQDKSYQSDQRFVDQRFRSRTESGYGPMRIKSELIQKGVPSELIKQAGDEADVDWFQSALDLYQRKYNQPPVDMKEKNRRMQFLARRGFEYDTIKKVLDHAQETTRYE